MEAIGISLAKEQIAILDALNSGDIDAFRVLIDNVKVNLNHVYEEDNRTLLDIACCDKGKVDFVSELLKRPAVNPNIVSKYDTNPLYFAIANHNVAALNEIAPKVDNGIVVKKSTPLNFLVDSAIADTTGSIDEYVECGRILLDEEFSVSTPDDSGKTPIYKASENKKEELVNLILDFEQSVDLDSYIDKFKRTARNIIEKHRLYKKTLPEVVEKKLLQENQRRNQMFRWLGKKKEAEFIKVIAKQKPENREAIANEDNGNVTFLQKAIDEELIKAVKILIESGADVEKSPNANPVPILRACERGNPEILRLLLEKRASVHDECLHYLFKSNEGKSEDAISECVRLLATERPDLVNYQDSFGNTALHIAAKDRDNVGVLELLRNGASLATRNHAKLMPVADICPELLKQFFDECITDNGKRSTDENYEIVFDYRCLDPYPPKSGGDGDDGTADNENVAVDSGEVSVEVEAKDDGGGGPARGTGDREAHPMLPKSSAACGDDDGDGTADKENVAVKSGEVSVLVSVEVEDDGGVGRANGDREALPTLPKSSAARGSGDKTADKANAPLNSGKVAEPKKADNADARVENGKVPGSKKDGCDNCHHEVYAMLYMGLSTEHNRLLTHPVVSSFLLMKWNHIKRIFYVNILFYVLFFFLLIALVVDEYGYRNADDVVHVVLLKYAVAACVCLLAFRELSQLLVAPKAYLTDWVNYFEIALITLSVVILLPYVDREVRQQLSVVVVMFSSIEFLLLVGKHPSFSTYIAILREVTWNFSKLLFWYSILLLAFALSFYLLFIEYDVDVAAASKSGDDDDDDDDKHEMKWFENPFKAALKTIVMFNGELNADDIKFEYFPATSYATFLLFVFMICIVLFNLLIGLAVDDVQKIRKNAEVVSHKIRIDLILYIENLILGDNSKLKRKKRNGYMERLAKSISLFCLHLGERKIAVKPNMDNTFEYGTTTGGVSPTNTMDKDIVKAAKRLLVKKNLSDDIVEIKKKQLDHEEILNEIRKNTSGSRKK